jgi:hypothetical protein
VVMLCEALHYVESSVFLPIILWSKPILPQSHPFYFT